MGPCALNSESQRAVKFWKEETVLAFCVQWQLCALPARFLTGANTEERTGSFWCGERNHSSSCCVSVKLGARHGIFFLAVLGSFLFDVS